MMNSLGAAPPDAIAHGRVEIRSATFRENYQRRPFFPTAHFKGEISAKRKMLSSFENENRNEYHIIRRTADKRLLKEPRFADLGKYVAKIKGFKLVGVRSCTTGRPDQGWSTNYDLLVRIPRERLKILSSVDFDQKKEWAKKNLGARLELPYNPRRSEIILTVGDHRMKSDNIMTWRNSFVGFLAGIAS